MTLKERIMQHLAESLVEAAAAVRVTINGRETLLITSDSHPALEREIGDGSETKVVIIQTAEAGFGGGIVDRLLANPIRIDPQIAREIAESPEFSLLEV